MLSVSAETWAEALAKTSWKLEHLLLPKEV
jgi:hypothetical protein